jgi:hypothetical protein
MRRNSNPYKKYKVTETMTTLNINGAVLNTTIFKSYTNATVPLCTDLRSLPVSLFTWYSSDYYYRWIKTFLAITLLASASIYVKGHFFESVIISLINLIQQYWNIKYKVGTSSFY